MSLSIVTNGFWNPDDFVPILTELETDSVTVGLDGLEETHDKIRGVKGSFKKAVDFLRKCKEAELPTSAITTAHKINFKEIKNMADLVLEDIGVDWQLQEAVPIGRFDDKLRLDDEEYYSFGVFVSNLQKKYSKERVVGGHNFGFHSEVMGNLSLYPEWNGCYAGISVLGIKHNGNVTGCLTLPDKYIEGNIRDINIVDMWNSPEYFTYNRKFKSEDLGENCVGCKYGLSCKGGCMSRSTTITDKPHNDPHCFYRIEMKK
jgi:radical SAM protein with 4Fe4S-binding SPASM domain